jgi:hypothetical protein
VKAIILRMLGEKILRGVECGAIMTLKMIRGGEENGIATEEEVTMIMKATIEITTKIMEEAITIDLMEIGEVDEVEEIEEVEEEGFQEEEDIIEAGTIVTRQVPGEPSLRATLCNQIICKEAGQGEEVRPGEQAIIII